MSSWKENLEYSYSVLDKIDILPYLKNGVEISDVMDQLESDYEYLVKDDTKLQGYLFNLIDTEDFVEYLEIRYPNLLIRSWMTAYYRVEGFMNGT